MNLEKTTVKIGLERPVKLLHVTDTHIALADERDDERKRALANRFGDPDKEEILRAEDELLRRLSQKVSGGKTILWITHRESVTSIADAVLKI